MVSAQIGMQLRVFVIAATMLFVVRIGWCDDLLDRDLVVITPQELSNGAPCLFTVSLHDDASHVTAEWQGHPVAFFSRANLRTWFASCGR